MALHLTARFYWLVFILVAGPFVARANTDKPVQRCNVTYSVLLASAFDTIPKNTATVQEPDVRQEPSLIKEVPKSKKQVKPIAVPVIIIKPVQIIKPKIIKPIIKIH